MSQENVEIVRRVGSASRRRMSRSGPSSILTSRSTAPMSPTGTSFAGMRDGGNGSTTSRRRVGGHPVEPQSALTSETRESCSCSGSLLGQGTASRSSGATAFARAPPRQGYEDRLVREPGRSPRSRGAAGVVDAHRLARSPARPRSSRFGSARLSSSRWGPAFGCVKQGEHGVTRLGADAGGVRLLLLTGVVAVLSQSGEDGVGVCVLRGAGGEDALSYQPALELGNVLVFVFLFVALCMVSSVRWMSLSWRSSSWYGGPEINSDASMHMCSNSGLSTIACASRTCSR